MQKPTRKTERISEIHVSGNLHIPSASGFIYLFVRKEPTNAI
jgi:hypothetical protein